MPQPPSENHDAAPPPSNPRWRQAVRRRLLHWFTRNARDLPWRRTEDPYRIWVSEVMLQQTQVVTVIPYYERFVEQFPNLAALAAANEQEVLRLWEGLGYYRRARQLHQAARRIVEQHGGQFPSQFEAVLSLPGIGRYTAGAILSIAFDQPRPILEANSTRVLGRLTAFRGDPTESQGKEFLWQLARTLVPRKNAGAFNQALMELGSEICRPLTPRCDICPLARLCEANRLGLQSELLPAKKKTKYETVCEIAVILRRRGKVLLRQCQEGERWAGLWDFLRFGVANTDDTHRRAEIVESIARMTGLHSVLGRRLTTIRHGVTRFRITLDCYAATVSSGRLASSDGAFRWVKPDELTEFPLSATGRKIGSLLTAS